MTENYNELFLHYVNEVEDLNDLVEIPPHHLIEKASSIVVEAKVFYGEIASMPEEARTALAFLYRCYLGKLCPLGDCGADILNDNITADFNSWFAQIKNITAETNIGDDEIEKLIRFSGSIRRDFEHLTSFSMPKLDFGMSGVEMAELLPTMPIAGELKPQNTTYFLPSYLTLEGGDLTFTQRNGTIVNSLDEFTNPYDLFIACTATLNDMIKIMGGFSMKNENSFLSTVHLSAALEPIKIDVFGQWQCNTVNGLSWANNTEYGKIGDLDHFAQRKILRENYNDGIANVTLGKCFLENPNELIKAANISWQDIPGQNLCGGDEFSPTAMPTNSPQPTSQPTNSPIPLPTVTEQYSNTPSSAPTAIANNNNGNMFNTTIWGAIVGSAVTIAGAILLRKHRNSQKSTAAHNSDVTPTVNRLRNERDIEEGVEQGIELASSRENPRQPSSVGNATTSFAAKEKTSGHGVREAIL